MASRAVSLTFHSDDMSAERPWRASEVRVWRRKIGYFAIIFVIVDFIIRMYLRSFVRSWMD